MSPKRAKRQRPPKAAKGTELAPVVSPPPLPDSSGVVDPSSLPVIPSAEAEAMQVAADAEETLRRRARVIEVVLALVLAAILLAIFAVAVRLAG